MKKILLLLLIFAAACAPTKLQTNVMTQYAGSIVPCENYDWLYQYPYPIAQSNVAILGDYKIVTEVSSDQTINRFLGCKENTCNGVFKEKDDYGCDIWQYTQTRTIPDCKTEAVYQCGYRNHWTTNGVCPDGGTGSGFTCHHYDENCVQGEITGQCTYTCGGSSLETIKSGSDCYSNHTVYYKDEPILQTGWIWSDFNLYMKDGKQVGLGEEDFYAILHRSGQYFDRSERISCKGDEHGIYVVYVDKGCKMVKNEYWIKKPDTITASIKPKAHGFDLIINNPIEDFYSEIQTTDEKQNMELPVGETIISYDTNSTAAVIKLFKPASEFSGINYVCYGQKDSYDQDVSSCDYIQVGRLAAGTLPPDECTYDSDCKACSGQKAECRLNQCVYEGKCRNYWWLLLLALPIAIVIYIYLELSSRRGRKV